MHGRDVPTESLRVVYEISVRGPADALQRAIAEACRRHRAHPLDVAVEVLPTSDDAPGRLVVSTPIPASREGRSRDSFLRDVASILDASVAPGWKRVTCESSGGQTDNAAEAARPAPTGG
jgi:hypothetical protein